MPLWQGLLLKVEALEVVLVAWFELPRGYHVDQNAVAVVLLELFTHEALHHVGPIAQVNHEGGGQGFAALDVGYQEHHMLTHGSLLLEYSLEERFPSLNELLLQPR